MGQGQIGFQSLLQLNKLCPIHPGKQTATAQLRSDCELLSPAWTCCICWLQTPHGDTLVSFSVNFWQSQQQNTTSFQSREQIQNIKAKPPDLFGLHFCSSLGNTNSMPWSGRPPNTVFVSLRGLWLMKPKWGMSSDAHVKWSLISEIFSIFHGLGGSTHLIRWYALLETWMECLPLLWNFQLTLNGQWTVFTSLGTSSFRNVQEQRK